MKKLFILITLNVLFLINSDRAYAAENSADSSAALLSTLSLKSNDIRSQTLKEFLKQYNSPLKEYAEVFVETADKYNLDWKLVAAISGVESTFGREIPFESFNGWGWGVYGNNVIRFSSWKEGIETVSKGLRENYIDKGANNVYQIGRIYAESPAWPYKVDYFMQKIDEFRFQTEKNSLPISL